MNCVRSKIRRRDFPGGALAWNHHPFCAASGFWKTILANTHRRHQATTLLWMSIPTKPQASAKSWPLIRKQGPAPSAIATSIHSAWLSKTSTLSEAIEPPTSARNNPLTPPQRCPTERGSMEQIQSDKSCSTSQKSSTAACWSSCYSTGMEENCQPVINVSLTSLLKPLRMVVTVSRT